MVEVVVVADSLRAFLARAEAESGRLPPLLLHNRGMFLIFSLLSFLPLALERNFINNGAGVEIEGSLDATHTLVTLRRLSQLISHFSPLAPSFSSFFAAAAAAAVACVLIQGK